VSKAAIALFAVTLLNAPPATAAEYWNQLISSTPNPPAVVNAAAIYDSLHDRMVVFGVGGGFYQPSCSDPNNLAWALSLAPVAWASLPPSNPCPQSRGGLTMVYDAGRDRAVMFGGSYQDVGHNLIVVNDTWALALSGSQTWSLLPIAGTPPPPRFSHCAIYDATRDRMIVYGGWASSTQMLDDLWVLQFSPTPTWIQIPHAGPQPGPRVSAAMVYDPMGDRALMFGGYSDVSYENSTWALDLSTLTWSLLATSGTPPSPREGMAATFDQGRNTMMFYGGRDNVTIAFAELWELSLTGTPQWSQRIPSGSGPGARNGHTLVFDTIRSRILLCGGATTTSVNSDTWTISPDESTPTLIDRFVARSTAGGIEIRWGYREPGGGDGAWIERSQSADGPWLRLDLAHRSDGAEQVALDAGVEPGIAYWYRLATAGEGGATSVLATATVMAAARAASAQLLAPYPSPSRGAISAEFTLTANARVRLDLLDVTGRRLATLASGRYAAGRSQVRWDARAAGTELRPGVYVLRLLGAGRPVERKLVIVP
jgi:hypothetical protein